MRKEKILQIIAGFMIFLIINIPVAFAQLTNPKVYGEDSIQGYAKSDNDALRFEVLAKIGNTTINPEQVRLWGTDASTGYGFNDCTQIYTGYNCFLEGFTPSTEGVTICPSYTSDINLYSENGSFHSKTQVQIVCDNKKPTITKFESDKSVYNGNDTAKFSFTITDTADVSGKCVGINKAVLEIGSTKEEIPIATSPGQCTYSDSIEISSIDSAATKAKLTAFDNFGNEASKEISIGVDSTPPVIQDLKVTTRDNTDITDWITGTIAASVHVYIKDDYTIDRNSIRGNLKELNIAKNYESIKPAACAPWIDGLKCRWDVEISLNESKNVNLFFEASDIAGNKVQVSGAYGFKVDNIGPEATEIKTDSIYEGIYYLKEIGNTITAAFTEAGIGMDAAYLDLTNVGTGVRKSNTCVSNLCTWNNVPIGRRDGNYKIRISANTEDKLGNKLKSSVELDVKVDITPPTVKSIKVDPVPGSNPLIEGYIQTGNALTVTAKVFESGVLTASADFSKFIKDAKNVQTTCTEESNNYWSCSWETTEIDMQGYIVNYILFNFSDLIGNSDIYEHPLIVLAAENETRDYWKSEVQEPSPEGIDKQLIALYDPYIWFPVDLKSKGSSNIWPLSVDVGECVNAEGESYGAFISSASGNKPELFNYNEARPGNLPYKIYLKYTLERAEPPADELPITCTLNIRTLVNRQRISQIETENITVEIPYYYNPLGTIDENIQAEIDRVSDSWLVKGEWIQTINTIMTYAKTICRFTNTLYDVLLTFAFIKGIFDGKCSITAGIYGCQVSGLMGDKYDITKSSLDRIYNSFAFKYCKVLNCQMWEGYTPKSDVEKFFFGRQRYTYSREGYLGNVDPQHSLVLSVIYLCLPGIFYNLQKARVIDCQYVSCLKQSANNVPLQMCTSQRAYGYCKFVWGEFFNLIPFAAAISYLTQNVRKALSHPLEFIGATISVPCRLACKTPGPTGVGCYPCTIAETFNFILNVLCDLGVGKGCEPIWDQFKVNDDACKAITDEDETEEAEEEGEPVA